MRSRYVAAIIAIHAWVSERELVVVGPCHAGYLLSVMICLGRLLLTLRISPIAKVDILASSFIILPLIRPRSGIHICLRFVVRNLIITCTIRLLICTVNDDTILT